MKQIVKKTKKKKNSYAKVDTSYVQNSFTYFSMSNGYIETLVFKTSPLRI